MRFWPFEPTLELSRERFYAIKDDIERASTDSIIVFGDSIVQGAPLPQQICGDAVVNAGVVGSGIEYFQRHAAQLLGRSHPKLIVLAVGINNASEMAARKFQQNYDDTVTMLSRTAPVVVATHHSHKSWSRFGRLRCESGSRSQFGNQGDTKCEIGHRSQRTPF